MSALTKNHRNNDYSVFNFYFMICVFYVPGGLLWVPLMSYLPTLFEIENTPRIRALLYLLLLMITQLAIVMTCGYQKFGAYTSYQLRKGWVLFRSTINFSQLRFFQKTVFVTTGAVLSVILLSNLTNDYLNFMRAKPLVKHDNFFVVTDIKQTSDADYKLVVVLEPKSELTARAVDLNYGEEVIQLTYSIMSSGLKGYKSVIQSDITKVLAKERIESQIQTVKMDQSDVLGSMILAHGVMGISPYSLLCCVLTPLFLFLFSFAKMTDSKRSRSRLIEQSVVSLAAVSLALGPYIILPF